MNHLDAYYRALLDYRAVTEKNSKCSDLRGALSRAEGEGGKITVTRAVCTVEEDWISAVEEGLVHIEKAIKQERQFIHSRGEVVPIEKVRGVSRESVEHLAKHSDLITKVSESDELVLDRLYSVERLNDYAVYENRFLYMLLCYLKDFISIRYDKIVELANRYDGRLQIAKEVTLSKQTLNYTIELHDSRTDDEYLRENDRARQLIDRIDLMLKTVHAFLATPLMESAAKAALLKPPITKTNVLKMDNNFKGALALYEFITTYDKDGYTVENETSEISALDGDLADDLSEVGALLSFLTYQYGLGIKDELRESYEREEARRRERELAERTERIKQLKRRLENAQTSTEEYILALEDQTKLLQGELSKTELLQSELDSLKENAKNFDLKMSEMRTEHERVLGELAEIEDRHREAIDTLRREGDEGARAYAAKRDEEMRRLEKMRADEAEGLRAEILKTREACGRENAEIKTALEEKTDKHERLSAEYEKLSQEKLLADARLKALMAEKDMLPDGGDFTDKKDFDRLEKEFEAFKRFYKSEWSKAKKKIRRDILNIEALKGKNEKPKNG